MGLTTAPTGRFDTEGASAPSVPADDEVTRLLRMARKIDAWSQDDQAGYDQAIDLLVGEIRAELIEVAKMCGATPAEIQALEDRGRVVPDPLGPPV